MGPTVIGAVLLDLLVDPVLLCPWQEAWDLTTPGHWRYGAYIMFVWRGSTDQRGLGVVLHMYLVELCSRA